jgi:hypothetical protein
MGREAAREMTPLMNVLGSDGTIRLEVPEGTEGAKFREYETSDGKKGSKWELIFKSLSGKITNLEWYEGDYGTNLFVTLAYEENGEMKEDTLSLGTATPFGEDFMKKLPNINLDEYVTLSPFSFTDDNGKNRRGISITQGDTKIKNFFYDAEKKKNIHKYPNPDFDIDKASKDDWKLYFMQARKFLTKYLDEHFMPKFEHRRATVTTSIRNTADYPEMDESNNGENAAGF